MTTLNYALPAPWRREHSLAGWLIDPRTWVLFLFGVTFMLVGLKTAQRMVESGMDFGTALWNAVKTRYGNHSSFLIWSHCLAIVGFAFTSQAKLARPDAPARKVSVQSAGTLLLATVVWWAIYFLKICNAPDPGTFASRQTGWLYAMQFTEGCLNLLVGGAAAFWAILVVRVVLQISVPAQPTKWLDRNTAFGLLGSCLLPWLLLLTMKRSAGWGWIVAQWSVGNPALPNMLGYTILSLGIYVFLLFFIWWWCARRISVFELIGLLRDVFKGTDKD